MPMIRFRADDGNFIQLERHESLPSAAALAKKYAAAGYPDRYAVFAERQTDLSLLGMPDAKDAVDGVFLSLILRPSLFLSQSGFLSILASAAACMALEEHTDQPLGIAWVSDIYCRGRRIGKVGIEGKLDSLNFYNYIILHFVILTDKQNFPPRIEDLVQKVFGDDRGSIHLILAKKILAKFFLLYPRLKAPKTFLEFYIDRFLLRGESVKFQHGEKWRKGKILGVRQEDGALLLRYKKQTVAVLSPSRVQIPKVIKSPEKRKKK